MKLAQYHKKSYEALKDHIISDIWFHLQGVRGKSLDMMERNDIPAIVLNSWDDGEVTETIDYLFTTDGYDKAKHAVGTVICESSCLEYCIEGQKTSIAEFDIPLLLVILETVEKLVERQD